MVPQQVSFVAREVVPISEGPLSEVPLYMCAYAEKVSC